MNDSNGKPALIFGVAAFGSSTPAAAAVGAVS
jgi:hypothetical protein